jgi:hypothetical protein
VEHIYLLIPLNSLLFFFGTYMNKKINVFKSQIYKKILWWLDWFGVIGVSVGAFYERHDVARNLQQRRWKKALIGEILKIEKGNKKGKFKEKEEETKVEKETTLNK